MPKRVYPFGKVKLDSVAQPLMNRKYAELCAQILQHMTGEDCDVVPRGRNVFYVLRYAGEKWIRA
jgi:hypothetical protein